ncbi:FixJ family two-component response regulator [Paraburkholderia youngii]|uniref:Response regulator n=1 Tax=Paraburkholderia youngii TaxID=2782701 RepID=A0ABX2NTS9_9BURK|nr:response regulator [Paraburkholderia youngii]NVI07844.1 response regulator [Paraburkholderia youngii]
MRASQVIWVVDDDPSVRSGLSTLLRSFDYDVVAFESAAEVLAHTGDTQPDCIVSDVQMPGLSGIELSVRLIENGWHIPTIFITAYPTPELHRQAFATGACALLIKPLGANDLAAAIESATSKSSG